MTARGPLTPDENEALRRMLAAWAAWGLLWKIAMALGAIGALFATIWGNLHKGG